MARPVLPYVLAGCVCSSVACTASVVPHPVIYAPRPATPTPTTLARTDVDVDCTWKGHRVYCAIDDAYTFTNTSVEPGTSKLELAATDIATRSIYIDDLPMEPYSRRDALSVDSTPVTIPVQLASRQTVRLLVRSTITSERSDKDEDDHHPWTLWTGLHPTFGQDPEVYTYSPVRYCFAPSSWAPDAPALDSFRLADHLEAHQRWSVADASASDCPALKDVPGARTATFEVRRHVPLVTSGGPMISAGYASHEGFVGELAFDLAISRYLAVAAGVHANQRGELDVLPVIGFPVLIRIGLPIRIEPTHKLGYRLEVPVYRLNHSRFAPGGVFFVDVWPGEHTRVGLMTSASF